MEPDADKATRFQAILADNRRRLQGIARVFAAESDRDDLYQDIALALWRSFDSFAGRSSVATWVYRVAVNAAVLSRRKATLRARHEAADVAPADRQPSREAGGRVEMAILQEFMAGLGTVDRALFTLYLDDLSYREMAGILGMSENSVGVRLSSMKRRFTTTYIGG